MRWALAIFASILATAACDTTDVAPASSDPPRAVPGLDSVDPADAILDVTAVPVGHAAPPPGPSFPAERWATADPTALGFDVGRLDAAADYAESIGSHCLLVIRDGKLAYERYFNGATADAVHPSWSLAKSYTSALIGVAHTRGDLPDLDAPIADTVREWRGTDKASITVRHLLSMNSGLHYDFLSDYMWSVLVRDQTAEALGMAIDAQPGDEWHYNNHAVQALHRVLQVATGIDPETYAERYLWGPIGMNVRGPVARRTHWERDPVGNPTMYMSVHATCLDMARFGYLFLNEGEWSGERVIDADYIRGATTSSTEHNRSYGYLWWLNRPGPGIDVNDDAFDGPMMPFAPLDLYSAQGLGQNFIDVVPSTNTIYVHMRNAPHEPLSKLLDDFAATIRALLQDGRRLEHKAMMELLIAGS